mmetsp:Transcript_100197/g.269114  ORF Transcript_100197/g.269114 Transcript_100197/m.269114 type:complete len:230 (-) Transcript_100197:585-1274(-)
MLMRRAMSSKSLSETCNNVWKEAMPSLCVKASLYVCHKSLNLAKHKFVGSSELPRRGAPPRGNANLEEQLLVKSNSRSFHSCTLHRRMNSSSISWGCSQDVGCPSGAPPCHGNKMSSVSEVGLEDASEGTADARKIMPVSSRRPSGTPSGQKMRPHWSMSTRHRSSRSLLLRVKNTWRQGGQQRSGRVAICCVASACPLLDQNNLPSSITISPWQMQTAVFRASLESTR